MKKTCFCFAAAVLLALAGLVFAHCAVSATADQVVWQEECLTGDLSAVEDLSLHLRASLDSRLFWDSTLIPGQELITDFRYASKQEFPESGRTRCSLDLFPLLSDSHYSGSGIDPESDDLPWPAEAMRQLAADTQPGETKHRAILASDYADVYPAEVHLRTPGAGTIYFDADMLKGSNAQEVAGQQFAQDLAALFSFPVEEGHMQILTVTRDEAGYLREMSTAPKDGCGISFYAVTWDSPQYLYFSIEATNADDSPADYSLTPGYGIYRLPADQETLTIDDVELIYPMDPEHPIIVSTYDEARDQLVTITEEEEGHVLHVIDLTARREVQQLALDLPEGFFSIWLQEDIMLVFADSQQAQFFHRENGQFVYQYDILFPDADGYNVYRSGTPFCILDGARLAILTPRAEDTNTATPYSNGYNASCALYVFDPSGTVYAGRFSSSLDAGYDGTGSNHTLCALYGPDALRLTKGGTP